MRLRLRRPSSNGRHCDQIGNVEGDALHLWHGDLRHRRYSERFEGFERFSFDPSTDIAQTKEGVWQWNSDKPDLHAFVRRYFESRRK